MARRYTPEKREVLPDIRYNKIDVQEMIHRIMIKGKKSTATRLLYDAFDLIEERTGKDPLETFDAALKNVSPMMEVRPRRVGGATYQVPMEVRPERRTALSIRWLLNASRGRGDKSMVRRLASELIAAANNEGGAVKKKDDVHRMAESNKAFAHFKW